MYTGAMLTPYYGTVAPIKPYSVHLTPVAGLGLNVAPGRVTCDRTGVSLRMAVGPDQLGSPRVVYGAVASGAEEVGPARPAAVEALVVAEPRHVRASAEVDTREAVCAQEVQQGLGTCRGALQQ